MLINNPAATGRLVNPHESKRSFEDRDRRADGDASLLLPLGIDDSFVVAFDLREIGHVHVQEQRVHRVVSAGPVVELLKIQAADRVCITEHPGGTLPVAV